MKKEILFTTLGALVAGGCSDNKQKQEIEKLLVDFAEKKLPENYKMSACHGDGFGPPPRIEYVCPICGVKSILKNKVESDIKEQILTARRSAMSIKKLGYKIALDERSLCVNCRIKMNPRPRFGELYLDFTLNGKTTRTLLKKHDMQKLQSFFEGKLTWFGDFYEHANWKESLLEPEIPRIRELLGLDKPSEKITWQTDWVLGPEINFDWLLENMQLDDETRGRILEMRK